MAFVDAIKLNNPQIIQILLQYYSPQADQLFYGNAIRRGHLNTVRALSQYFPLDEEGFWVALQNNQVAVANFLRDRLWQAGRDPINNVQAINNMYEEEIHGGNMNMIQYLVQFSKPRQEHVNLAEELGEQQIADFLRTRL